MILNTVPFAVDILPECLEKEPNDSSQTAQPVTLPLIVNGRMDHPGDRDVFHFAGRAGERIFAEVQARRLDSPLDSVLKVTDAAGKRLAFNDDHEDKSDGLKTHHADSLIDFSLPADGKYYLYLSDAQHESGPEYAYRLRGKYQYIKVTFLLQQWQVSVHQGHSLNGFLGRVYGSSLRSG